MLRGFQKSQLIGLASDRTGAYSMASPGVRRLARNKAGGRANQAAHHTRDTMRG